MNVLLVDDHPLFLSGLRNLLEAGGVTVAGTAKNGVEALAAALELRPDLILMDINMAGGDGLSATRSIIEAIPEAKIVILTMDDDDESLFRAIKNGASGYLLKNLETEEFFASLERLVKDEMIFSPGLAQRAFQELRLGRSVRAPAASAAAEAGPLTPRQEEVLAHVARGLTYKKVAETLKISQTTVKFHMKEILARLHLENRTQAIAYLARSTMAGEKKKLS